MYDLRSGLLVNAFRVPEPRKLLRTISFLTVLFLSFQAQQALAQFSSGIEGTVKEPSGNVVAGRKSPSPTPN